MPHRGKFAQNIPTPTHIRPACDGSHAHGAGLHAQNHVTKKTRVTMVNMRTAAVALLNVSVVERIKGIDMNAW